MEYDTMTIGSYALLERLGKGSFASVYLCEHMKTKQSYAGKLFKLTSVKERQRSKLDWEIVEDEVSILKRLKHHHTIKFEDIVFSPYGVLVIMELVQGRSLIDCFPEHGGGFFESFARSIFTQLLEVLEYLHSNGIVHRDLKLENVMVESDGNLRLIDYGLAQHFANENENFMVNGLSGSTHYYAPELLECGEQKVRADKTDIWAAGVLLYMLVSGLHPFDGDSDEEIFQGISSRDISFEDVDFSLELEDLICKILHKDPGQRATIPQIIAHPWTQGSRTNLGFTTLHGTESRRKVPVRDNVPLQSSSCIGTFPSANKKAEFEDNPRLSPSCSGKFVPEKTGQPTQIKFPLVDCSSSYSHTSTGYTSETEDMGCGLRIANVIGGFFNVLVVWFFVPSRSIRGAFGEIFARQNPDD